MRAPHRRTALLTTALLLALASGSAPGAGAAAAAGEDVPVDRLDTVAPGTLTVAPDAAGSWRAGELQVSVTTGEGLRIESAGRTVWAAPPASAFVVGGRGTVSWQENRGYFWPTVQYDDRLGEQTIDAVEARDTGDTGVVVTGTLAGAALSGDEGASYTLTIRERPAGGATLDLETDAATPLTSTGLVSGRSDGAGVHGFGEQFADFDLDGRLLPIVDREQGVGRGEQPITPLADLSNNGAGGTDQMTYAAWASYVTDDLRGLRLDAADPASSAFATADLRDSDGVSLELWAPSMRAQASAADDPAALIAAQQSGDERAELGRWATRGAILGLQGGTKAVRAKLRTLLDAGTKVSAVWLQDWTGHRVTSFGKRLWWTWQLDRGQYPHWHKLVADLAAQGIRTTTYVNPMLVDASERGDGIRNLWAEARDLGYLVENADGAPYLQDQGEFEATLVDLTNPDAVSWFADIIATEVLADGVSGFMADFGEGLPMDAQLYDGNAAVLHNRWPALWAHTVRLGCERAGQPKCATWFRSGALGQAADAPLFWAGDQLVTWSREDGLASALLGMLSAGVSGWPLVHSDIGGYTSVNAYVKDYVRTPELLQRWAELQAFGVAMRTHEGNRPDVNPQVYSTHASAKAFARMTKLFRALAPYRRSVVREAVATGVPAMRAGWLVAPGTAADNDSQFFLGSSVLVAPVLEEGADTVDVELPPGRWMHLLTGERFRGDRRVSVAAPLGQPAAFVRAHDPWAQVLRTRVRKAGL